MQSILDSCKASSRFNSPTKREMRRIDFGMQDSLNGIEEIIRDSARH